MTFQEAPATDSAESSDITAPEPKAPAVAPEITPEMQVDAQAGVDAAFAQLREQPKVRIRIHKDLGPQVVIINGARYNVPSNVPLMVPEQVAQVLEESGRI